MLFRPPTDKSRGEAFFAVSFPNMLLRVTPFSDLGGVRAFPKHTRFCLAPVPQAF